MNAFMVQNVLLKGYISSNIKKVYYIYKNISKIYSENLKFFTLGDAITELKFFLIRNYLKTS